LSQTSIIAFDRNKLNKLYTMPLQMTVDMS